MKLFDPRGLSAPAPGLYTCILPLFSNIFLSENGWPINGTFHVEPFGHMTKMTAMPIYEGGSIYNGNTLITPPTKALELYAICGTKDQGLTYLMVYKTLFYVSYLLRFRLLKQAHIYTLNTFKQH